MIALLAGLAFADTPEQVSLQAIAVAEWRRQSPASIAAIHVDSKAGLRAQIRALGRVRQAEALPLLLAHQAHSDPEVRAEVAFALGLTPGAAPEIRRWLQAEQPETGLLARLTSQYGTRWQLIEALGRAGDASDVTTLSRLLEEAWPYDEAAARALLRLHRREIDVSAAIPALAQQVLKGDPRTVEATASSLARMGTVGLPTSTLDALVTRIQTGPSDLARAELVRAVGSRQAIVEGMKGGSLSRRAALGLVAKADDLEATGVSLETIRALASSSDGWLALGARQALAKHDPDTVKRMLAETEDSHAKALLIDLLGHADPAIAEDENQPWSIRAAHAAHLDDIEALVHIATSKMHPAVQTAAAGRLLELKAPRSKTVALLQSADVGVREAAMEMLKGAPDDTVIEEIILSVRVESDGEVLRAGFDRLTDFLEQRSGSVPADRFLVSALKRGAASPAPRVHRSAATLAKLLKVEVPPPKFDTTERELILPDGTVTTTTGDLPKLLEVGLYTSATITTERGAIELSLRPDVAPMAVFNFASLAQSGFYDGQLWHRVVPGFVVQGGCPRGDGWGGPGWTIPDEVSDRPFVRGGLGMARGDRDTAGSQFFIMTGSARFLEGDYTWFGQVSSGDHVTRYLGPGDRILNVKVHRASGPDSDSAPPEEE